MPQNPDRQIDALRTRARAWASAHERGLLTTLSLLAAVLNLATYTVHGKLWVAVVLAVPGLLLPLPVFLWKKEELELMPFLISFGIGVAAVCFTSRNPGVLEICVKLLAWSANSTSHYRPFSFWPLALLFGLVRLAAAPLHLAMLTPDKGRTLEVRMFALLAVVVLEGTVLLSFGELSKPDILPLRADLTGFETASFLIVSPLLFGMLTAWALGFLDNTLKRSGAKPVGTYSFSPIGESDEGGECMLMVWFFYVVLMLGASVSCWGSPHIMTIGLSLLTVNVVTDIAYRVGAVLLAYRTQQRTR